MISTFKWNRHFRKALVNKTFTHVQEQKNVAAAFRLNSVQCKITLTLWMCVARFSQSTQNNNFAIPLQYFKENILLFFPVDKRQRFLQIDTTISSSKPKLLKIRSLLFLCNILRKKQVMKFIFLHPDKLESFLQTDSTVFDGNG